MKYSIDRIEENIAVCEGDDGNVLKLKLDELPKGTREGDIIEKRENGFIIDADETQLRRKNAKKYIRKEKKMNSKRVIL